MVSLVNLLIVLFLKAVVVYLLVFIILIYTNIEFTLVMVVDKKLNI